MLLLFRLRCDLMERLSPLAGERAAGLQSRRAWRNVSSLTQTEASYTPNRPELPVNHGNNI
jgi:hypothetical protein